MKKYVIWFLSTLCLGIVLTLFSRFANGFAEWYARGVYPFFVNTIGRFFSLFPFSVAEILIVLTVLSGIVGLVFLIRRTVKGKGRRKKILLRALALVMSVVSSILLVFTMFCGINYQREPFSKHSGLEIIPSEKKQLEALIYLLAQRLNEFSESVETDEHGVVVESGDLRRDSIFAMENLAKKYPTLNVYYPNAKGMLFSELMSYQQIQGIYIPFTIEANYNANSPASDLPFIVCHELSHLSGYMREDEANFIAFLACDSSESVYFKYSGYMYALIYALNAYHPVSTSEEYASVYDALNRQVAFQFYYRNRFFDKYETVIADIAGAVNDTYLKANNQTDGTQSYGRMVDLLLAYFREDIKNESR